MNTFSFEEMKRVIELEEALQYYVEHGLMTEKEAMLRRVFDYEIERGETKDVKYY